MTVRRDIPPRLVHLYQKRNKSRKAAIRSFCAECMGYETKDIPGCTDEGCPLYRWRISG